MLRPFALIANCPTGRLDAAAQRFQANGSSSAPPGPPTR
jgi:hypothetical protein